jgi:hypothetical protein
LLNSAYEDNFFNHACPPHFDIKQDVSMDLPNQTCGKNFTGGAFGFVYCNENYPFCRPAKDDDTDWRCMTSADNTNPVVDYHPSQEWSNVYIPPHCAGVDANVEASLKVQKNDCLKLLSDIKTWYWLGGRERFECNHGVIQTRGSSEVEATQGEHFCGTYTYVNFLTLNKIVGSRCLF